MTNRQKTRVEKSGSERKHGPKACIYCNQVGNLTETHIWPSWLKRAIAHERRHQHTVTDPLSIEASEGNVRVKHLQGDLFNRAPKIACAPCNNVWMNRYEERCRPFFIPMVKGESVSLTRANLRDLTTFMSFMIINAEFIHLKSICIPPSDRLFLRRHNYPPENTWSIFIGFCGENTWRKRCVHQASGCHVVEGPHVAVDPFTLDNTQVTTMGIGALLVHAVTAPAVRRVQEFQVTSEAMGLTKLWPEHLPLWPFGKRGLVWPLKQHFDAETAEELSNHEARRIQARKQLR